MFAWCHNTCTAINCPTANNNGKAVGQVTFHLLMCVVVNKIFGHSWGWYIRFSLFVWLEQDRKCWSWDPVPWLMDSWENRPLSWRYCFQIQFYDWKQNVTLENTLECGLKDPTGNKSTCHWIRWWLGAWSSVERDLQCHSSRSSFVSPWEIGMKF